MTPCCASGHCPRPLSLSFVVITLGPTLQSVCIGSSHCIGAASASTATASEGPPSPPPSPLFRTISPASGNVVLPTSPILPSLLSHSSTLECEFPWLYRSHCKGWGDFGSAAVTPTTGACGFLSSSYVTTLSLWSRDDGICVASEVVPSGWEGRLFVQPQHQAWKLSWRPVLSFFTVV